MYRVINVADSGKTKQLMKEANECKGFIVCRNTNSMARKADAYGFKDVGILSYDDYFDLVKYAKTKNLKFYIDELETFIEAICPGFAGYSMTLEEGNESR